MSGNSLQLSSCFLYIRLFVVICATIADTLAVIGNSAYAAVIAIPAHIRVTRVEAWQLDLDYATLLQSTRILLARCHNQPGGADDSVGSESFTQ